jgi:hypothetical protein
VCSRRGPESGQDFPGSEALDELAVVGVGDGVEVGDEPAFERADLLVGAWQDAAGHEELAQVCGGPPGLQSVNASWVSAICPWPSWRISVSRDSVLSLRV